MIRVLDMSRLSLPRSQHEQLEREKTITGGLQAAQPHPPAVIDSMHLSSFGVLCLELSSETQAIEDVERPLGQGAMTRFRPCIDLHNGQVRMLPNLQLASCSAHQTDVNRSSRL